MWLVHIREEPDLILSLETSTKAFSVSLFRNHKAANRDDEAANRNHELANIELIHDVAHSQNIVSIVDFLLKSIDTSIKDISEIYAGNGPGSFTGIRIGLSFANTILQTMNIPLLGIPSLDLLAFDHDRWYNSVITYIKSRKNEVYTASYRNGRRTSNYLALKKEDFLNFVKEHTPVYLISSEDDYRDLSFEKGEFKGEVVFTFPKARNAYIFAQRCNLKPEKGYLKPLYVRDF